MMTSLVRGDLLSGNLDPPKSSTHQNVVVLRNPQTLSFEDLRILGSEDFHHVLDVCQPPSTPPLMDTLLADTPFKSNIQVLQADIVYDKELRISSLEEGLQYLARQLQLLPSKYPGREIKMAHMVSHSYVHTS